MNISLPETMRKWVDEQVESGGYGTASEYMSNFSRDAERR